MSDAQTWTLIGGFFAILIGMLALVLRLIYSELERTRSTIRADFQGEFSQIREGLAGLTADVKNLDKDVSAITQHLFGTGSQ